MGNARQELNSDDQFCSLCGYALDLHGTCEIAEKKVQLMNDMLRMFVR